MNSFGIGFPEAVVALGAFLFVGSIVGMICWMIVTLVRGRPPKDLWDQARGNAQMPPMFEKLLDKAMAERDRQHAELLERIQVLERIVTDTHRTHDLADEIEKLRDSR